MPSHLESGDALDASTGTEEEFFERGNRAPDSAPVSVAPDSLRRARRATGRGRLARGLGVVGALASLALLIAAFLSQPAKAPLDPGPAPATLEPKAGPVAAPTASSESAIPTGDVHEPVKAPPTKAGAANDADHRPTAEPSATETPPPMREEFRRPQTPARTKASPTPREPALTQEEIRRRKDRYERWLREQGLQRVDEVTVPKSPEVPAGAGPTDSPR